MAFRFNAFSALFAALTVAVVYLSLKELTGNTLAAFFGGLTLAFSSTFWSHAVVAGTCAMTGFFIVLFIYLSILWRSRLNNKYLYLLLIPLGLGLGTHPAMLLAIPAGASAMTAQSFLKVFFTSIRLFVFDFTPIGFIVILIGISFLRRKFGKMLAALSAIVIGNVLFMTVYGSEDILPALSHSLFPSYIVLSIWAGCGLHSIHTYIHARLKGALASSVILAILPLACLITHYQLNDQSKNFAALDYGRNIFKTVPRGSVLLSSGDTATGSLQYLQTIAESGEGVVVIDEQMIFRDSYCRHLIKQHPDTVPEDICSIPPEKRLARLVEANSSKAPLYTTFPLPEGYEQIPYGLVYKIYPEGAPTDFAQIKKINDGLWKGYAKRGLLAPHIHTGPVEKEIVRKYAQSQSDLGAYYSDNGHIEEARAAYEESLKIDPDNFSGLFNLGELLTESGNNEKGADLLEKAMDANPDFFLENTPIGGGVVSEEMAKAESHAQSGHHYVALGDHKKAIEEFQQAIELKPDDFLLYILLGHAYINVSDTNMAFDTYQKAIALNPGIGSAVAYLNLGVIYMDVKHDYPNAIIHFEKYIELVAENDYTVETRNKVKQIRSILLKLKNALMIRHHPRFSH